MRSPSGDVIPGWLRVQTCAAHRLSASPHPKLPVRPRRTANLRGTFRANPSSRYAPSVGGAPDWSRLGPREPQGPVSHYDRHRGQPPISGSLMGSASGLAGMARIEKWSYRTISIRAALSFRLRRRSATGDSPERSGHLSADVDTPSFKRIDDLRRDAPRPARKLFDLGFVHTLEYGVANADLKPSTLWADRRFTLERLRLRWTGPKKRVLPTA